ncbi:uncharacterized protein LOC135494584 isoform X2 [Lineus longissimus]|uniref:uncharacterized protein LOC135494584 isoform X2 n=1 Tax=Lineus longissimus TaxID=88925 RepID=UPI00315D27ED
MPSSRRSEILSHIVVAVLSSLIICSFMLVIINVQFGEILARQDEQIKELKVAIAEAKACCRKKEASTAVSPLPTPAAYQHAERPVRSIRHRRKRRHQDNRRQVVRDLRHKINSPPIPAIFQVTAENQSHNVNNYTVYWQEENTDILDSDEDPTLIAESDPVHYGRIVGIKVKKQGFFSVYAQVKFKGVHRSMGRVDKPYQTYYITKAPDGLPNKRVILLEKTITQASPDRRNRGNIEAIDMAFSRKFFYLEVNDVVYLQIGQMISHVIFDKETYLGLVYYGDKRSDYSA